MDKLISSVFPVVGRFTKYIAAEGNFVDDLRSTSQPCNIVSHKAIIVFI